jgi:prepilin-type N-terminal cleavage/methylation domain-containing protein
MTPCAKYFKKKIRGFTLMEMVLVLVVIGLLLSIIVPRFSSIREEARGIFVKKTLQNLGAAIELYAKKQGVYPTSLDALVPDYLKENICGQTKDGYMFYCTFALDQYSIMGISPSGGCPTWTVKTGGVLENAPECE